MASSRLTFTEARKNVRELRRGGRQVSFTAWMVKAIGNAVGRNKLVHAVRLGRRKVVVFDDVDVGIPVEREVDGKGVPLALRIGAVNRKSVTDIEAELQGALNQPIRTEHDFVLNDNAVSPALMRIFTCCHSGCAC